MKKIDFSQYHPKAPTTKLNERQALIKEFHDILSKDWDAAKYGDLKAKRIAIMLSPVKTKDLYSFLAECKYASNFSKYYWSRFKKYE